jgi:hypothetical protein
VAAEPNGRGGRGRFRKAEKGGGAVLRLPSPMPVWGEGGQAEAEGVPNEGAPIADWRFQVADWICSRCLILGQSLIVNESLAVSGMPKIPGQGRRVCRERDDSVGSRIAEHHSRQERPSAKGQVSLARHQPLNHRKRV